MTTDTRKMLDALVEQHRSDEHDQAATLAAMKQLGEQAAAYVKRHTVVLDTGQNAKLTGFVEVAAYRKETGMFDGTFDVMSDAVLDAAADDTSDDGTVIEVVGFSSKHYGDARIASFQARWVGVYLTHDAEAVWFTDGTKVDRETMLAVGIR